MYRFNPYKFVIINGTLIVLPPYLYLNWYAVKSMGDGSFSFGNTCAFDVTFTYILK